MSIHVAAAVFQRGQPVQTLAVRKSSGAMTGYWEFPGGKREAGESIQECLTREIREELGVGITDGDLVGVYVHNNKSEEIVLHAYLVRQWTGELQLTEHDSIRWLSAAQLLDVHWSPADVAIARAVQVSYCR